MVVTVRYDSIPCEPGILFPAPVASHSPRIYSTTNYTSNEQNRKEIVHLVTSFTPEIWIYFATTFIICAGVLTLFAVVCHEIEIRKASITGHFSKSLWEFFMLVVDMAPSVISKLVSASIIWTAIVITAFYAFHCVFFNTLSADLSVPAQTEYIESLEDLLNNPHFNVTPVVTKQLPTFSAIEKYKDDNGSLEQELYRRLISGGNRTVLAISTDSDDATKRAVVQPFVEGILSGQLALIEDSGLLDPALAASGCHDSYGSRALSTLHISKETFAGGLQGMLVSRGLDPIILEWFQFKINNMIEFGLYPALSTGHDLPQCSWSNSDSNRIPVRGTVTEGGSPEQ